MRKNKMKEIKFRIWGVDFERYFYNVGVLNGQWYIAFDDDEPNAFDCIGVPNEKEFIIEQFTGMFDKNGKEIYEGDIVKYTYNFFEWHYVITNRRYGGFLGLFKQCVYRNFTTSFDLDGDEKQVFGDYYPTYETSEFVYVDGKDYEVIGNIREGERK